MNLQTKIILKASDVSGLPFNRLSYLTVILLDILSDFEFMAIHDSAVWPQELLLDNPAFGYT